MPIPSDIMMTVSRDSEDLDSSRHQRSTTPIKNIIMSDSGLDTITGDYHDAPVTPPSAFIKSRPFLASANNNPPEVRRHGRPINRRLFLASQEAQERLSLPDLFAPRATPTPHKPVSRRMRSARMLMMAQQHQQMSDRSNFGGGSLGIVGQSSRVEIALHPRAVQWGDYFDNASHRMSQRSVYGNPADL